MTLVVGFGCAVIKLVGIVDAAVVIVLATSGVLLTATVTTLEVLLEIVELALNNVEGDPNIGFAMVIGDEDTKFLDVVIGKF